MSSLPAARLWQGTLLAALAGASWGVVFIAPKILADFTPLQLSAGRYLAYGVISLALLIPAWGRLRRLLTAADWMALAGLSLCGNIFYYVALSIGVGGAGVSATSLIIGALPVTIALFGRREAGSVGWRGLLLPLVLVALGVVCINADLFRLSTGPGGQGAGAVMGVLAAFAALAAWTVYAVWNSAHLKDNPRFSAQDWSLLMGAVTGLFALILAVPAFGSLVFTPGPTRDWGLFWGVSCLVAVSASVFGSALWNQTCRLLPLSLAGPLTVFETLFALTYGFVFAARWPRPLEWAAVGLMVAGIVLATRRHV